MHDRHDTRSGIAAGIAAYLVWGVLPVYFHHLSDANPLEVLCFRIVLTFVVTAVALQLTGQWRLVREAWRTPGLLGRTTLAAVAISLNWSVYIWAAGHGHVVDAALGYFINPVVSVAIGVLVLGERLRPLQTAAVGLGVLAVIVLTIAYGKPPWISLLLAGTFAYYGYLKKAIPLPALPALCVETSVVLVPALICFTVLGVGGHLTIGHLAGDKVALLFCAGFVTAIPLVLFGVAAQRVPLSLVGLLQYLTPVMQMLLGVAFFHEHVPIERWIGFGIVWCALVLLLSDALAVGRASRIAVRTGTSGPARVTS